MVVVVECVFVYVNGRVGMGLINVTSSGEKMEAKEEMKVAAVTG